ncbi:MAG: hypothetical protein IJO29_09055 [Oscillospiraceae bacterium]|nr:hypothetical protein [Oscillospiraceae bacterium]
MKLKKTTALIAVLALCAGTMTACEDKSEELLRLVDSGDFKGAYDYYDEEIDGTNKEDAICDEFADEMEDRYEDIADKCYEGEYDEDDIEDLVELLEDTDVDEDDYEEYYSEWQTAFVSKQSYEDALDYMDDGDYSLAASYFELVDERDSNYDDAQKKIEECQVEEVGQYLDGVAFDIENGYYDSAASSLDYYREEYADNEAITERIEELDAMISDAITAMIMGYIDDEDFYYASYYLDWYSEYLDEETYADFESQVNTMVVEYALTKVDEAFDIYAYNDAKYLVDGLCDDYPENAELADLHGRLEDAFVQKVTEDVNVLVGQDDYDGALDILSTAIEELGDNEELETLYDQINASSCEGLIDGVYFGMTESDVVALMGAPDSESDYGEYSLWSDGSNDVKIDYHYIYGDGIPDLGIDKPSVMFFEFKAGALCNYGIYVGVKISSDGQWNYSCCKEEELAEVYGKLSVTITDKYGEGIETDIVAEGKDEWGYRAEYNWYDTQSGNIWLMYGIDLWGDDTGADYMVLGFSDPAVYPV